MAGKGSHTRTRLSKNLRDAIVDEDGTYEINSGETLTGKDYISYMKDIIRSRNDPAWFVKNILNIELFPKQEEMLINFYQHKYDPSLPINKRFISGCGMRTSPGDTLVLTSDGYKRLDSLVPKHDYIKHLMIPLKDVYVYNEHGWVPACGWCYCGEKELWTIETSSGKKLSGSSEHKIRSGRNWIEFKDLKPYDVIKVFDIELFRFKSEYIHSITRVAKKVSMYDIYVPEGHSYVANSILSHNSGKTVLASVMAIYEFFELISLQDPAAHFDLLKNQEIFITAVATSKQLAQDGIFANCRNNMENNDWFNQWFNLNFKEERIDALDKHCHMQVLGSWATTAVGRSNKCVVFDELALFEKTEGKRGAFEIYTRLSNSTATFGLHGKVVAISSPQSHNDIIMQLYRTSQNTPNTYACIYPTWEVNPKILEADLREECKYDMARFWRDFACQPSAGGGVQFPEGLHYDRERVNVLKNLQYRDTDEYIPRVLSIDPAARKDSFGVATAYLGKEGLVVDGARGIEKEQGQGYISPEDVWTFLEDVVYRLNVYAMVFDTWMYVELIEKMETKLGLDVIKHITNAQDFDRWLELDIGQGPFPLTVVYDEHLEREVDNLLVETTPTGKKRVDHPRPNGKKDISDAVCNAIWFLTNRELSDEDATPLGRGIALATNR